MIKGYELYELIAKGNTLQNTKIIDARNKVWKFDGTEFVKETGDSDVYSDLEFATMDFKIIEDEEEIDIQSIDIIRDYRTSEDDLYNDNFEDFRGTINELVQAVKQLDKKVNSIEQK